MIDEKIFELVKEHYNLTKPQLMFANYLIKKLNEDYDRFHYIDERDIQESIKEHFNCELTQNDISYTYDKLEHDLYLIDEHYEGDRYKITHNGKELAQKHGELIPHLLAEIKENFEIATKQIQEQTLKTQIDNLTLEQLKGNIFQVKKWWLIIIINAAVTLIISVIVALIIKGLGID